MMFLSTKIGDITVEQILFAFFLGLIALGIVAWVLARRQHIENRTMPIKGQKASLIDLQKFNDSLNWATFEVDDGTRVRLSCATSEPYLVGDKGYLKWQGMRLISFSVGADKDNSENWICYSCGTKNANGVKMCQKCGVSKQWSDAQAK